MENSERDGSTRPPDLPLEKPVCKSGSNNYNWTWNNRLVPNWKGIYSGIHLLAMMYSGDMCYWGLKNCVDQQPENCEIIKCHHCLSQEAGQVVWYSHLFKNFPQFIVIHIVEGFGSQ